MKTTLALICAAATSLAAAQDFDSHPPMRPLPQPNPDRPIPADGPVFFVDGSAGDDANAGTEDAPWRSIGHAAAKLRPGDTLLIRGGVYHEHVRIEIRATAEKPVTIGSYPGELAILDGGIADFQQNPAKAWEPLENGEFRSARQFPGLGERPDSTNVLGNFADSMIPLHGYRFLTDLRSDNHLFHRLEGSKTAQGNGLYCGPGVFYDAETQRIHVRLAPTQQPSRGEANNYRGESDPRKIPLVIAGRGKSALSLVGAAHVVLRDLVVRGSREATIDMTDCSNITLDGVTSYGGQSALRVVSTSGLRCANCAFRGIAAPWLWRWSLKYRSIEARIVSASAWNPPARGNRDFEFAFCEFTDCVDGVFIGNVDGVLVRNCLLDNVSDDGFFITCRTAYDGSTPGGDFTFRHNRISGVLSAFAFGVGHGRQRTIDAGGNKQLGKQTTVRNNVFDLRGPVLYQQPKEGPIATFGRVSGDHGSPAWEPIDFIENTVLSRDSPWRGYYAAGWGKAMGKGTRRRIERNRFVHDLGLPGQVLPAKEVAFAAKDNVHWSHEAGEGGREGFLQKFRASALFSESGWTQGDTYANPATAPETVGAGPDAPVGQFGRLGMFGNEGLTKPKFQVSPFLHQPRQISAKRAALILGYPAFDAPMLRFALEKAGFEVDVFERTWVAPEDFAGYGLVGMLGSTVRAKMEPSGFAPADFAKIRAYLENGGQLAIGRELLGQIFPGAEGLTFVESIAGTGPRGVKSQLRLLQPQHPWLAHLETADWLGGPGFSAMRLSKGVNLIGDSGTARSVLCDVPVGKGRFVYVGWDLSRFLPEGRRPSTLEQELAYERQYQIYERMARSFFEHEAAFRANNAGK